VSDRTLEFLRDHVLDHRTSTGHLPRNPASARVDAWRNTNLQPVQCQSCLQWFAGRRCQRCFPPFQLRRPGEVAAT